ncbi:hypothetical protein GIB67_033300 [Kingdonia uniflora]|uniref:Uncharacterized protein n=1 Tax=Kingdonia uniflora TaxID=39325 RepID=A0A7J7KY93_9MAGN|nr:hypothetical protein GIB67_033300 [Kingdonia uniflora]
MEDKLECNGYHMAMSAYKISKATLYPYTRKLAEKFSKFRANYIHPGNVKTDITGNTGDMYPDEGARARVMLASGSFFDVMEISSFI